MSHALDHNKLILLLSVDLPMMLAARRSPLAREAALNAARRARNASPGRKRRNHVEKYEAKYETPTRSMSAPSSPVDHSSSSIVPNRTSIELSSASSISCTHFKGLTGLDGVGVLLGRVSPMSGPCYTFLVLSIW